MRALTLCPLASMKASKTENLPQNNSAELDSNFLLNWAMHSCHCSRQNPFDLGLDFGAQEFLETPSRPSVVAGTDAKECLYSKLQLVILGSALTTSSEPKVLQLHPVKTRSLSFANRFLRRKQAQK